jgi:hypothetical protein
VIQETYQRYLSRLLLTFSDLADSDAEIAQCLALMKITPPINQPQWTPALVRSLMPSAYATACTSSDYATDNQTSQAATAYCATVYRYIKAKEQQ